jgi:hypothetical protein
MELSLSNPANIIASGEVGLGGILSVTLANDVLATLGNGSSFEILSFAGEAYGVTTSPSGISIPNSTPIADGASPFSQTFISPDVSLLFPNLNAIVQRLDQGIFLSFIDPTSVGGGATGADFNGDGIVDQADLAIWQANKGIVSGASVLQGDANGDGAVDGADYLIWLDRFTNGGAPGGSPGAFGSPSGTVPEPTGLVMLSIGSMLALAFRRRCR